MIRLTNDRRKVGGVSLGAIWVGDSSEEERADLLSMDIGAILNVAQDMVGTRGWYHDIEAMHVGLVDGPGNEIAAYYSAVLALHALLRRHNTIVCCHTGGRALAVAVMYMDVGVGRTWQYWMDRLSEYVDATLPEVNQAHVDAFNHLYDHDSILEVMR